MDEPTLSTFASTDRESESKLLNIFQDIVYLALRGKKLTPKALALGMYICHLTGSARLLSLVNRLGHCASANTVIALETSLAELQLSSQPVPKGFAESVPTIAVWDNIDFGEETRSGAGTTHRTNGILVQAKVRESPETTQR